MKRLPLLFALLLMAGCTSTHSHIGVIVPEGTSITYSQLDRAIVRHNVTGTDSAGIFLFLPLGFPNFNTAIQNTLRNGDGNILTNINITDKTSWYILFGYQEIIINADVINITGIKEAIHE